MPIQTTNNAYSNANSRAVSNSAKFIPTKFYKVLSNILFLISNLILPFKDAAQTHYYRHRWGSQECLQTWKRLRSFSDLQSVPIIKISMFRRDWITWINIYRFHIERHIILNIFLNFKISVILGKLSQIDEFTMAATTQYPSSNTKPNSATGRVLSGISRLQPS